MDIIKAMNLKKYYTSDTYEVRALDGVSLTVEDGEFIAVVGTSGCGKTTLMNILGGLDTPDFGGVWIRNTSLKDLNKEERTIFRRRNIGFVFQQYNLIPSLSIREQRVSIARALLTKPAIVLADEPTGNLDSVTSMEVVGLLRSCAARFHQTTLIVTHQEEVAQMADRVIRMSDGKIYTRDCNDC